MSRRCFVPRTSWTGASYMRDMTHIDPATEAARENARQKNGEFGEQEHSAPEAPLVGGVPVIRATAKPTTVVYVYSQTEGGYVPLSVADARKSFGIPDTEPEDVVLATVDLLSKGDDPHPPGYDQENRYADPGEGSAIDTAEWSAPGGMTWDPYGYAWRDDDSDLDADGNLTLNGDPGCYYADAIARFDITSVGYGETESFAAGAIAADWVLAHGAFEVSADEVCLDNGHIRIRPWVRFGSEEFTPKLVERKLTWLVEHSDPREHLRLVKEHGIVLSDEDLVAARHIDGRAVAYAAAAGRIPTDAEAIAVATAFDVKHTIQDGYVAVSEEMTLPADTPDAVAKALTVWHTNRPEKEQS